MKTGVFWWWHWRWKQVCFDGDIEDENRCVLVATLKMKTGVLCGDPEDKNKCVFVVTLRMKTGAFLWWHWKCKQACLCVKLKMKTGDFLWWLWRWKEVIFVETLRMKRGEFCGDIDWPLEGDGEQVGHFGQVLGHRCWKTLPCNNKGQCLIQCRRTTANTKSDRCQQVG